MVTVRITIAERPDESRSRPWEGEAGPAPAPQTQVLEASGEDYAQVRDELLDQVPPGWQAINIRSAVL